MKNITRERPYTRSTAEDERESLAAQFSISAVEPDPTKILPDGVYTVIEGQLRPVVARVSPEL